MAYEVEKTCKCDHFSCVIIMTDMGHRCGYVGVSSYHPLYRKPYNKGTEVLTKMLKKIKKEPIGKRGILSVVCWNSKKTSPEIAFDVHGSITYSGGTSDYPIKQKRTWWFGYDCGHAGDGKDLAEISNTGAREIMEKYPTDDPIRSLEYCIGECESLAKQLNEVTKGNKLECQSNKGA